MKRLLLLFGMIVVCKLGLVAQTYQYHPLVDTSTKEWNYSFNFSYGAMGGGTIYKQPDVLMSGDTLFNGLRYRIVTEQGGIGYYDQLGVNEDSTRKVFFKQFYDTSSSPGILIFDFSLNPGDTFISYFFNTPYIVQSIDTIFLGGALRREFLLFPVSTSDNDLWVEGIGSLHYALYPDNFASLSTSHLCRERENGEIIYASPTSYCYFAGVNEISPNQLGLHLYPNPNTDICTVEVGDFEQSLSASILDITGREVMPLFIDKTISTFTINTNALVPGVYLIKVSNADGRSGVVKMVKE